MTVTTTRPAESGGRHSATVRSQPGSGARDRFLDYLRAHRLSAVLVAVTMVLCALVTSYNIVGNPIRFKDEGVYLAQAWAIPHLHALANYTYWYDHPPLGWIQMSAWATVTDGWDRWHDNTTMAGREFMIVIRVIVCALVFILARRLGMRRFWATVAALLFVLSPLALYYGRLALLDNVAMPWLLASFVLALSPRRRWSASIGCAVCFAVAVDTKETVLVLAPALLLALWTNYRSATNRSFVWVSFVIVLGGAAALYPLYAVLKNELVPGPGHVSLWEAIQWQLSARKGSGSIFDQNSDARNLLDSWLNLDRWLPVAGCLAAVPLLLLRRTYRPVLLALLIQAAMLLRQGYLPSMYVDGMIPFMALAVAGLCDTLWPRARAMSWLREESTGDRGSRWRAVAAAAGALLVAVFWLAALPRAGSEWRYSLGYQWSVDADASERETIAWLRDRVPHDAVLVSEGELWLDLHNAGFAGPNNVWVYKVDSDPAVIAQLGDWHTIDYLALSHTTLVSESKATMPRVFAALDQADKVAEIGTGDDQVTVFRVRK